MFTSLSKSGQVPFTNHKARVMNRCGSTALAVGDVVAFDTDASQTETQNLKGINYATLSSLTAAMFANVIEVGAAPQNGIIAVVTNLLGGDGEDNTEVEVQFSGRVLAKVGGTDWSSTRASCGVAVMADTTGANRRLIAATDGTNSKVGLIIEAIDENLSASNKQQTEVLLLGIGNAVGTVGA
jgi:hypothetical protein